MIFRRIWPKRERKNRLAPKQIDLVLPEPLRGPVPLELEQLAARPDFQIAFTEVGADNRADQLAIYSSNSAHDLGGALRLCAVQASIETAPTHEAHPNTPVSARCMACGDSLMSNAPGEVVRHVTVNIWLDDGKGALRSLSPERSFCSWSHLSQMLQAMPGEAHLILTMRHMLPGYLTDDFDSQPWVEKLQAEQ